MYNYAERQRIFSLAKLLKFAFFCQLNRFFLMYNILPETEARSLEDIELHYSDNAKGITDIHIQKKSKAVE